MYGARTLAEEGFRADPQQQQYARVLAVLVCAGQPVFGADSGKNRFYCHRAPGTVDVCTLAISAISGEVINSANLRNIKDVIAYAPGVTGNSSDSYINNVSTRGIYSQDFGTGGNPSSAVVKGLVGEVRG